MSNFKCVFEPIVGRILLGKAFVSDEIQKEQVDELFALGFSCDANNQSEEAIRYFKQVIKICPRADAYNGIGVVHLRDGEFSKAMHSFRAAISIDSSYLPAFYNLGVSMYCFRSYDVAIKIFENLEVVEELENWILASIYNEKGCAQSSKGDKQKAEKSFEAAMVIDSKFIGPLVNLGNMYCAQGRLEDAKIKYNKALQMDDKCASTYNGLGVISLETGNFEEAIKYFNKALALDKECAAAEINMLYLQKIVSELQKVAQK